MKNYLAACLHCAAKFFINLVIFGENLVVFEENLVVFEEKSVVFRRKLSEIACFRTI